MGRKRWIVAAAFIVCTATIARADFAAGLRSYETGDYFTAYKEWLPLAEAGDPAAQRNLGHLYRLGRGVTKDFVKALDWYRKSAEQGFSRAQANLGNMYLLGQGVPKDPATAARWFGRAAKQNHPIAQYNLGLMYENGIGMSRDDVAALGWYFRASKAGHRKAAQRLARLVARGAPPPADADERPRLASAQRDEPALPPSGDPERARPGALSSEEPAPARDTASAAPEETPDAGLGVALDAGMSAYRAHDYESAFRHWLPRAESGDSHAQFFVGGLYRDGAGVPVDPVRAYHWWALAAAQGHPQADRLLAGLRAEMLPKEIAAARELSE